MKVCPKCNSTYSDATLNYCLADGSPLVEDGITASEFSNSWHDSETLLDDRQHNSAGNGHQTSPNTPANTVFLSQAKTETFQHQPEKSGKKLYLILGAIFAVLLIGGGIWWFTSGKNPVSVNANSNGDNSSQTPRVIVSLSPEQDAKVKKEITDFIETWRKTNEDREIDKHIEHYANTLDYFYKESSINRNKVRASRQQAYEMYPFLSLQIDKLKVTPESETSAAAVFDKSWTFKNDKKTTTGSVQQEMHIVKQNGKWQIVGEKDLNVYFINNRTNEPADNSANSNADANANTNTTTVDANK